MKATTLACLCLLAASAHGEWIQTVGLSERCIALGGACVAKADDYGAYYHNPAAATAFEKALIGGNFRILDTTRLDLRDSAGNQSVPKTNAEGKVAIAPTLAGYFPLRDRITFGIGLGAPFAITADWDNDEGMHRYNMSEQALFVLDLTPTIAFAVNERLSLGVGLNLVALKHLRLETLIPQSFGAALPPALGGAGVVIPTTPDSPVIGSITLETDGDVGLGIPPDQFAFVLDEFALTLGAQYRASDRLTLGAVYRSQTDSSWEGDVTLEIGGVPQTVGFDLDLDLPGHLQAGFAYDLIPDQARLVVRRSVDPLVAGRWHRLAGGDRVRCSAGGLHQRSANRLRRRRHPHRAHRARVSNRRALVSGWAATPATARSSTTTASTS